MINVDIEIKKQSFRGWIQFGTDGDTIQHIHIGDHPARVTLCFDCIDEWQKFIDLFNVTDITDMRLVKD